MSLRLQAIDGVRWTAISSGVVAAIQFAKLAILARLLSPVEFGLFAMMTVFVGYARIFADLGISNAIIHKQDIEPRALSTLYWVNVLSGSTLTVLTIACAPLVAWFFQQPLLVAPLMVLSLTFVVASLGSQFKVLDQKALRFRRTGVVEVLAATGSLVVAVTLAARGFGVYALVWPVVVQAAMMSAVYIGIGFRSEARPSLVFDPGRIRGMFRFGMFQMGQQSVNYFNSQLDVLIVGKLLGVEVTGLYSIAKQLPMKLIEVINPIVTKVAFPLYSKVQDDRERLSRWYLVATRNLAAVTFPVFTLLAIIAEPLVLTVFGPQWRLAVPILQLMAMWALVRALANPIGSLLLAKGRAALAFYWNLGIALAMPLVVVTGTHWGAQGVAAALLVFQVCLVVPAWYFLVRPLTSIDLQTFIMQYRGPVIATACATVAVLPVIGIEDRALLLISTTLLGGAVYLLASAMVQPEFLRTVVSGFRTANAPADEPASVSIIIPTHNRRDLLARALRSALAQTHPNIEVIVVDDGSSDATVDYLAGITDSRVRVLRHDTPKGACAARNAGIQAATGRFLTFLDDDDEFLPTRVARMMAAYEPQYAYVATGIRFINSRGWARRITPPPRITTQAMLFRIVTGNSVLVERDRVLALGGFDERLASSQDYDLWLRLNLAYGDGVTVTEPLLVMHTEHEHARITRSPRKLFGHLAFIRKHRRHMSRAQRKYKIFEVRFLKGNLRLRDIPVLVPFSLWPYGLLKYVVCVLR